MLNNIPLEITISFDFFYLVIYAYDSSLFQMVIFNLWRIKFHKTIWDSQDDYKDY